MTKRAVVWALSMTLIVCLFVVQPALGADRVFWGDANSRVRVGNLDGTPFASNLFSTDEGNPRGIAIDPAAGKIYWAGTGLDRIRMGNLDGTGTPSDLFGTTESGARGVAIDPAAGKIYWALPASGKIRVGNLNGTGTPSDLFPGPEATPVGVAIDPAAGKIYWATSTKIRIGNLNGTGTPSDLFPGPEATPTSVAIDPAAGKIYWTTSTKIRVGNLNGTGTPADLFGSSEMSPVGVAIDPAAGKIYWGTNVNSGAIRVGNLDGTGAPTDLISGELNARFPALLRAPAGTVRPQISGGTSVGSVLTCSPGSWAGDLLGSFLYRAPRSLGLQWSLNGTDIGGATTSTYTASSPGSYTCRETATNQAGSTSQTSDAHVIPVPQHTLTATTAGSGAGTVTSSPAGIDCGAACSAQFDEGNQVILTATPAPGSSFSGFSGDCSGVDPCTITMGADRTVTANFDKKPEASCTVPKVKRGSSLRAAKGAIRAAGCTPGKVRKVHSRSVHRGKVIRLRQKPGTVLSSGTEVGIVLSKGRRRTG